MSDITIMVIPSTEPKGKRPFIMGQTYLTQAGEKVTIVDESNVDTDYYCVKGDDNKWRYARKSDCGRVTASAFDMSCPHNLIVPEDFDWSEDDEK